MNTLPSLGRVKHLIDGAIALLNLDLNGIAVLTEVGSGPFVVTPLIAATAGSDAVYAVCRDSRFGSADEVIGYGRYCARKFNLQNQIRFSTEPARQFARDADLVTNLNHVRPIDESFVENMRSKSAVSLMFETWEHRARDVDLAACRRRGIPVLGTNESDGRLQIFRYVGMCALKLLLEAHIEVFRSQLLVIGSAPFGSEVETTLEQNGAEVLRIDPETSWEPDSSAIKEFMTGCDAVVLAEHHTDRRLIGKPGGIPLEWLARCGVSVIHICGNMDANGIQAAGLFVNPRKAAAPGWMSVTTGYVGPRPVIDLHAGGLSVGEALVNGLRRYGNAAEAVKHALTSSPAMEFEPLECEAKIEAEPQKAGSKPTSGHFGD